MRLKKSQLLLIGIVAVGVATITLWYSNKKEDAATTDLVVTKPTSKSIDEGLIFDRKNRLLISASTTLGTQLLLEEVGLSFGEVKGTPFLRQQF